MTLQRLHRERFGAQSSFLPVFDRFTGIALEGMRREELALYQVAVGGRIVAIQAWMEVGSRLSYYQSGRARDVDRWSAGTLLVAHVVAQGCARGFTEVDFLRGAESYKKGWADYGREVVHLWASLGARARVLGGATHLLDSDRQGRGAKRSVLRLARGRS